MMTVRFCFAALIGCLCEVIGNTPPKDWMAGFAGSNPAIDTFIKFIKTKMTLGVATELTKQGKAAARKNWGDSFIYYVPANSYPAATVIAKKVWGNDLVPYNAYFAKKEQNNTVSIWFPTAEDLLAEDWVEVVL